MARSTPPTAEEIFCQASYFRFAAGVLHQHLIDRAKLADATGTSASSLCGIPYVVMIALSTELYLKSLLILEKGSYIRFRDHGIKDLYNQVTAPKQKFIKEYFESHFIRPVWELVLRGKGLPVDPKEFEVEAALQRINKTFVEWRYAYEYVDDATSFGDDVLCDAVMRATLDIKPDWEKFLDLP